ncbi:MAG: hypothetical protein F4188_07105 [Chloroflexi bacterium]|nr:hypothetical protein [Chloroflexota bacterium]
MPNPDGWFAGVEAGRQRLRQISAEAFEAGLEDGERLGREEALMFLRTQEVEDLLEDEESMGSP